MLSPIKTNAKRNIFNRISVVRSQMSVCHSLTSRHFMFGYLLSAEHALLCSGSDETSSKMERVPWQWCLTHAIELKSSSKMHSDSVSWNHRYFGAEAIVRSWMICFWWSASSCAEYYITLSLAAIVVFVPLTILRYLRWHNISFCRSKGERCCDRSESK